MKQLYFDHQYNINYNFSLIKDEALVREISWRTSSQREETIK
jgi:hypothetical protein